MKKIMIGTRGSELAIAQSKILADKIELYNSDCKVDLKIIKTLGDINKDARIDSLDRKGVFTKEIEDRLKDGSIDIAVHSMKDMPSIIDPAFHFPISLKREDSADILIMREGLKIEDFLAGYKRMRIGTGSKRRILQLSLLFKNTIPIHIRGNIGTRIKKIAELNLDAVVLASAGINRLNLRDLNAYRLPTREFLPAPCQGLLAVQVLKDNKDINSLLSPLNDEKSFFEMQVERRFIKKLGAGCHSPMGFHIEYLDDEKFRFIGLYGDENLKRYAIDSIIANKFDSLDKAEQVANSLKEKIGEKDVG
ncbi:MAG: hydroxymethylbilane synthase [Tissierellia bacterium]|nr:hydroxymethylbilane synthase [Tissierellia bacterium]